MPTPGPGPGDSFGKAGSGPIQSHLTLGTGLSFPVKRQQGEVWGGQVLPEGDPGRWVGCGRTPQAAQTPVNSIVFLFRGLGVRGSSAWLPSATSAAQARAVSGVHASVPRQLPRGLHPSEPPLGLGDQGALKWNKRHREEE